MKHYDYIFAGAGLSALMTAYRMVASGKFRNKTILLIDSNQKNSNDRTWCFWEDGKGMFDEILYRSWEKALFADRHGKKILDIKPYRYKMIRSIDFYRFIMATFEGEPNISFLQTEVFGTADDGNIVSVTTDAGNYTAAKLLTSLMPKNIPTNRYPLLRQHFEGWFVKTSLSLFTPEVPIFMDFSVSQKGNTRFMYVLPFSENEALVEYTLFSEKHLPPTEYGDEIDHYLKDLGATDYEITEKERGSIPMTVYPFWNHNSQNILYIGSAGGWTKASTGYTFKNTMKKSRQLADFLAIGNDFRNFEKKSRFWFYDLLLLDILYKKNEMGSEIFSSMFRNADPRLIFKFLDEETTIVEDLKIIGACPKRLFLSALFDRVIKR